MQTSLQGIAKKARELKKHRFGNLYQLLNREALAIAWNRNNKKAAAGVDKVTTQMFDEHLEENLNEIVKQLKEKRYRAKLVKRVNIPKGEGKTRPLGIPAIADKLVQSAAAQILGAIYEEDFYPNSYGYRPRVGVHTAVRALSKELILGNFGYIVEADIAGFFQNIDHEWLIKMLEQRVDDKAFIGLIKKWLKAGVLEPDGKVINPVTGCPQGGIISPILANIYLHYVLDLWFEKRGKPQCRGEAYLCRYADDFVCAFRYKADAEEFYWQLGERLRKFGLETAPEKTHIISFSRYRKEEKTSFDFLGFEFRWGTSHKGKDMITKWTTRKKLRDSLMKFKEWCVENRNKRLRVLFKLLNSKLRGYYDHYGLIGNSARLRQFYQVGMKILYKWLNRRSQMRSFNQTSFAQTLKRYGVLTPRITETSYNQIAFKFNLV